MKKLLSIVLAALMVIGCVGIMTASANDLVIDTVILNGVVKPEDGNSPVLKIYPTDSAYKVTAVQWIENGSDRILQADDTFVQGTSYDAWIYLETNDDYTFLADSVNGSAVNGTIDGLPATFHAVYGKSAEKEICAEITFTATPSLTHSFEDWKVTKRADVNPGEETRKAIDDPDYWETRVIPATGDPYTAEEKYTYTGKVIKPVLHVYNADDYPLKAGVDYNATFPKSINVGEYKIKISYIGKYKGTDCAYYKITKAQNPMKVTAKKTVTAYAKKRTEIKAAVTVKKAQGKVTYKTNNKKVTVKNGTMIVQKGLKKGKTYTVKVTVTANGNKNYNSLKKAVSVKVKVK